jgi:hypothetical protein
MERKCIWKNFLLLTVSGLLALHLNLGHAQDGEDNSVTSPDATDSCILGED